MGFYSNKSEAEIRQSDRATVIDALSDFTGSVSDYKQLSIVLSLEEVADFALKELEPYKDRFFVNKTKKNGKFHVVATRIKPE